MKNIKLKKKSKHKNKEQALLHYYHFFWNCKVTGLVLGNVKGCGHEIYYDANNKSQSGKWIPLDKDTGLPHHCQ
jgi:hypothetical protein